MLTLLLVSTLSQLSFTGAEGGLGLREKDPPVQVRIDSDDPTVQLYRHLGTQVGSVWTGQGTGTVVINSFSRECQAPCGEKIAAPGDTFFIGGDGVTTSDPFQLVDHGQSVTLKVHSGRSWMRTLGAVLLTTGIVAVLTSGILFGVALLTGGSATVPNPYGSSTSSGGLAQVGFVGLVGGGLLTVGGLPLIAFSGTSVEFLPGLPVPAAPTTTETADL